MRTIIAFLSAFLLSACVLSSSGSVDVHSISPRADGLPQPITRRSSDTVVIDLVTKEVTGQLAPGVTYEYWTFNGTVPGPFLRVREGDTVEIRLTHSAEGHEHASRQAAPLNIAIDALPVAEAAGRHDDAVGDGHSDMPEAEDPHATQTADDHAAAGHDKHSIDLHAVIGPGGGAMLTQVTAGQTRAFRFIASRPGLYVYHCASPHIPTHVANGMYGLILVEPRGGLPSVDREFAVVQGEFYTEGPLGQKGHQAFSKQKMLQERPEYVVFNGSVGALTKEHALRAKAGETIRLFFGVGSHVASNLHIIGGVFDRLYPEGAIASVPLRNVQTTVVPPGGSMMAEFTIDVPGTYLLVDHSLTRAIDRGAVAELVIEGEPRPDLYVAVNPDPSHTHADIAVYVAGERLDFSAAKYMEEEGDDHDHDVHGHEHDTMHMHGGVGHVIHRHKPGQTVGDFFTSIGFTLTSRCLTTDAGEEHCNAGADVWRMFVNGRERAVDPGYAFGDGDRILLTYGATAADVAAQLAETTDDACLYSRTCPERGDPPEENCVADPSVPCTAPLP